MQQAIHCPSMRRFPPMNKGCESPPDPSLPWYYDVIVLPEHLLTYFLSPQSARRLYRYSPPVTYTIPPPPGWPVCVGGGRLYSNLQHSRLFSNALSQISLSSLGPDKCTGPGAVSVKVECLQGAPPHLYTQTSYAGTRALIRRQGRIVLYNGLFPRSILTRHRGVHGVFLPWGKGLRLIKSKSIS